MTPRALALLAAAAFGLFVIVLSGELRAQAPPALFGEPAIEAPVRSDDRLFVTRARTNTRLRRLSSQLVDRSSGIICDQFVELALPRSLKRYPQRLRRIRFKDPDTDQTLVFLTNHFALPSLTICKLYKMRWQVELFFKWIKQHLRIKAFFGNSENAVKTQIWIAVSTYVLVAIVRKRLNCERSMYEILQILSLALFEKTPLDELLTRTHVLAQPPPAANQLNLLD